MPLYAQTSWQLPVVTTCWERCIASVSWNRTARVWDVTTGHHPLTWTAHQQMICAVSRAPAGSLIASARKDKISQIWDARSGLAHFT
ncbi:MAG TPA: hypothetical protein VFN35_09255 [Ktedonobacteraceae bacterium]|nr:hypothetical protein [Ktedonobacteraceae bacterium]